MPARTAPIIVGVSVLVQPELEKRRFPLVKVPPLRGGDFQGMGVYRPMRLPDYEYAAREDQLPRCLASARRASPGYPLAWLHPCRARFRFAWRGHCSRVREMCKQRYGRAPELPLVTRLLELAIARRVDLGLSPGKHILRRHITDGAV